MSEKQYRISMKFGFPDYSSFEVSLGATAETWKKAKGEVESQLDEAIASALRRFAAAKAKFKGLKRN